MHKIVKECHRRQKFKKKPRNFSTFVENFIKAPKPNRLAYEKLISAKQSSPRKSQEKWCVDCSLQCFLSFFLSFFPSFFFSFFLVMSFWAHAISTFSSYKKKYDGILNLSSIASFPMIFGVKSFQRIGQFHFRNVFLRLLSLY